MGNAILGIGTAVGLARHTGVASSLDLIPGNPLLQLRATTEERCSLHFRGPVLKCTSAFEIPDDAKRSASNVRPAVSRPLFRASNLSRELELVSLPARFE